MKTAASVRVSHEPPTQIDADEATLVNETGNISSPAELDQIAHINDADINRMWATQGAEVGAARFTANVGGRSDGQVLGDDGADRSPIDRNEDEGDCKFAADPLANVTDEAVEAAIKQTIMRSHPLANMWLLSVSNVRDLATRIAAQGQLHPIKKLVTGEIIFGRTRAAACLVLGHEPRAEVHHKSANDPTLLDDVLADNHERRHESTGQRIALAARLRLHHEQAQVGNAAHGVPEISRLATLMKVSERSVASALAVHKKSPDLFALIEQDYLSVNKASELVSKYEPADYPEFVAAAKGQWQKRVTALVGDKPLSVCSFDLDEHERRETGDRGAGFLDAERVKKAQKAKDRARREKERKERSEAAKRIKELEERKGGGRKNKTWRTSTALTPNAPGIRQSAREEKTEETESQPNGDQAPTDRQSEEGVGSVVETTDVVDAEPAAPAAAVDGPTGGDLGVINQPPDDLPSASGLSGTIKEAAGEDYRHRILEALNALQRAIDGNPRTLTDEQADEISDKLDQIALEWRQLCRTESR